MLRNSVLYIVWDCHSSLPSMEFQSGLGVQVIHAPSAVSAVICTCTIFFMSLPQMFFKILHVINKISTHSIHQILPNKATRI